MSLSLTRAGPYVPATAILAGETRNCFEVLLRSILPNASTRRAYSGAILRACYHWEGLHLRDIDEQAVADYLQSLNASIATKRLTLSALRCLFVHLANEGVIPVDPTRSVRMSPPPATINPVSIYHLSEKAVRLVGSIEGNRLIDLRDRALLMALACGFTIVDVIALKVSDFRSEGGDAFLCVRSGGEARLPLPRCVAEAIEAYFQAGNLDATGFGSLYRTIRGKKLGRQNPIDSRP